MFHMGPLPIEDDGEEHTLESAQLRNDLAKMKRSKSAGRFDHLLRAAARKRRPPPKGKGGSEAVTVEPDRPKQGEGGAAAALEFDE